MGRCLTSADHDFMRACVYICQLSCPVLIDNVGFTTGPRYLQVYIHFIGKYAVLHVCSTISWLRSPWGELRHSIYSPQPTTSQIGAQLLIRCSGVCGKKSQSDSCTKNLCDTSNRKIDARAAARQVDDLIHWQAGQLVSTNKGCYKNILIYIFSGFAGQN